MSGQLTRRRRQGFALIATSNALLVIGVIVIVVGVFTATGVIVVGAVIFAVAVVLSLIHARRRGRRMKT